MHLTGHLMNELATYALDHTDNPEAISFPFELTKRMQGAVSGWRHLETEEVRERVQDILQDIVLRHGPFRFLNQNVVEEIQAEANFQISTSKVHLYTLIPILGLSANINPWKKIHIDDRMYIRRIHPWEASKFESLLWGSAYELPKFALEYVQEICPSQLNDTLHDDSDYSDRIRFLLGLLQFKLAQGLSFPWIIQYVPQCQFIKNHGKMSARILPMGPGEYEIGQLSVGDLKEVHELVSQRDTASETIQSRVDVAMQRFHDAKNRTTVVDSLVDYWIALEALVGTGKSDQTRQMAARIASFLFSTLEKEHTRASYIWLQKSYNLRSKVVHGDHYKTHSIEGLLMYKVNEQTREVVKFTVQRMLKSKMSFEQLMQEIDRISFKMNFPPKREFDDKLDTWSIRDGIISEMDDVLTEYRKQHDAAF